MSIDFHKEINELNSSIKDLVNADIYDGIDDAVNYSSTATEMLLKLKFYFSKINIEDLNDENLITRIETKKNKIDNLLT